MKNTLLFILKCLLPLSIFSCIAVLAHGHTIALLEPKGIIALQEHKLMVTATLLMLVVVLPVFALTAWIAWTYRASNTKAKYTPNWDHNSVLEFIWWAVPCSIIFILAIITWNSSHQLDPYKKIASSKPPITIQVVALPWKWLFIYPQQQIATVNYVQFPKDTPIHFVITADAPMNSFWIPQLGGQIYAMPGMSTQLNLMADGVGTYAGSSANLSGEGFAGMKFTARSSTETDFNSWVDQVRTSRNSLNQATYSALAKPSKDSPPTFYSSAQMGLYDTVIMKFMAPSTDMSGMDMSAMQPTNYSN
jgi:cytochrome o ubiquinol oxidase subunit 2